MYVGPFVKEMHPIFWHIPLGPAGLGEIHALCFQSMDVGRGLLRDMWANTCHRGGGADIDIEVRQPTISFMRGAQVGKDKPSWKNDKLSNVI